MLVTGEGHLPQLSKSLCDRTFSFNADPACLVFIAREANMPFTLTCHVCGQKLTLFDLDVKEGEHPMQSLRSQNQL